MDPIISVIIPVNNAEETIEKTLLSFKKQTHLNFDIIIVDDNSTDKSYDIVKKHTKNILRNKTKKGPAITRNKGIRHAKTEIIAFIDADCIATPNWLNNVLKEFQNKNIQVIAGNTKIPKSTFIGDSISALGFPGGANAGFENMWHVSKEGFTNHITSCNFAAKKEIFKKYGLFDESFPLAGGEDPELSYRLSKNGVKIKYCPDVLVYHEPRNELSSFIKWMIYRGRSNYYFKKKVGKVENFIKLRVWSSKNIIKKFLFDPKIVLIIPLLFLSFILQQLGYVTEYINTSFAHKRKNELFFYEKK